MKHDELKLLIQIAQMYYEKNMTQAEIAEALGIYRTTISRHLKRIADNGIVTFAINYDICETFQLEKQLKERFDLLHVIVTNNDTEDSEEQILSAIGQACANHLQNIIKDNDVIGFSWGRSMAAVAKQCSTSLSKNALCIPMVGGPAGKLDSQYHVNTIVYTIASKLHCQSLLMDFPAILDEESLREAILKSNHYLQFAHYWNKLNIALFGIGSNLIQGSSIWQSFYANFIDEIQNSGMSGDICSHFFNTDGKPVATGISSRVINIGLDKIQLAKHRIGVAFGEEKVDAIIAAMKGSYLNTLVTTKETAQAILKKTIPPG